MNPDLRAVLLYLAAVIVSLGLMYWTSGVLQWI